jgi:translation initiation factor 2 beta subunit (eIF-2beta)/eIF-5
MTQGQSDGRNPKFRVLCKRCNSYLHTTVEYWAPRIMLITCTKCGNNAKNLEEEQT